MYIDTLALHQFRNYESAEITFSKGINILYGDNAQGKTNILEAIYLLATTKSHRGNKDKEMIGFGYDESHIRANIKKHDINHRIDMHLRKSKSKGVAIDLVPIKRSAQLLGLVNIILFSAFLSESNHFRSLPAFRYIPLRLPEFLHRCHYRVPQPHPRSLQSHATDAENSNNH